MPLASRKIPVSFWRVNPQTENAHSNDLLTNAFDALNTESLTSIIRGESHTLDAYEVTNSRELISGALVRTRHTGLPLTYEQRNRRFGQIPLTQDQGLGTVSCFVFEKRRRLLLLEGAGGSSTTAVDWCTYFRAMMLQNFERLPIIQPSIIQRHDARNVFDRFTRYTTLKLHLARLRDVSMFTNEADRRTLTSAFAIADASGSDEVICTFKVPSKLPARRRTNLALKPSLERSFVRRIVDACEALGPGEVTLLEVTGEEQDVERLNPLNLLTDRIIYFISAVPFTDTELPNAVAVRHRCTLITELFTSHATVLQSVGGV